MTKQYRAVPTYNEPLSERGNTSSAYYRFLHDVDLGTPPAAEVAIVVGVSPFTYIAARAGFVIVNGGTVSQIKFGRTATYVTGQTTGTFPVALGDQVIVTYSGAPAMTFVPL